MTERELRWESVRLWFRLTVGSMFLVWAFLVLLGIVDPPSPRDTAGYALVALGIAVLP